MEDFTLSDRVLKKRRRVYPEDNLGMFTYYYSNKMVDEVMSSRSFMKTKYLWRSNIYNDSRYTSLNQFLSELYKETRKKEKPNFCSSQNCQRSLK